MCIRDRYDDTILEYIELHREAVRHSIASITALDTANAMANMIASRFHLDLSLVHISKPIYGTAGSGMHINMSLFKDGKNVFFDPDGDRQLSKDAYHFIAGLLTHVKGMTAITNPLVNSYKRLVPGYEAPCYLSLIHI